MSINGMDFFVCVVAYTLKYYTVVKMKKLLLFILTWMNRKHNVE
jgi:hypothetical protein